MVNPLLRAHSLSVVQTATVLRERDHLWGQAVVSAAIRTLLMRLTSASWKGNWTVACVGPAHDFAIFVLSQRRFQVELYSRVPWFRWLMFQNICNARQQPTVFLINFRDSVYIDAYKNRKKLEMRKIWCWEDQYLLRDGLNLPFDLL